MQLNRSEKSSFILIFFSLKARFKLLAYVSSWSSKPESNPFQRRKILICATSVITFSMKQWHEIVWGCVTIVLKVPKIGTLSETKELWPGHSRRHYFCLFYVRSWTFWSHTKSYKNGIFIATSTNLFTTYLKQIISRLLCFKEFIGLPDNLPIQQK